MAATQQHHLVSTCLVAHSKVQMAQVSWMTHLRLLHVLQSGSASVTECTAVAMVGHMVTGGWAPGTWTLCTLHTQSVTLCKLFQMYRGAVTVQYCVPKGSWRMLSGVQGGRGGGVSGGEGGCHRGHPVSLHTSWYYIRNYNIFSFK